MNGLATRARLKKALHPDIHGDVSLPPDHSLAPRNVPAIDHRHFGLPPLRSPHDVEARIWFRRTMIALCIAGFAIIFMPDALRHQLNAWFGTPTKAQPAAHDGVNTRLCVNDFHERCLVCTHLDATGNRVKSTHC